MAMHDLQKGRRRNQKDGFPRQTTRRANDRQCFTMLAERNSLADIHRINGIKEETVSA